MRVSVAGTEVLANPDPSGPPVLLHPRHVARLAGAGGNSDPVLRQIERLKLPTHSAWGYDDLLAPKEAERVVKALLEQQAAYERQHRLRLEFMQWQRDDLARRQAEAHAEFLRKQEALIAAQAKHHAKRRELPPPPPVSLSDKSFEQFVRDREKQEVSK